MHQMQRKNISKVVNKAISIGKHKLVDSVEDYKMVIVKKSDFAHESKELARFTNRLKNNCNFGLIVVTC